MAEPAAGDGMSWLHPTSLLFSIGAVGRGLLLPIVAVLVFSRQEQYPFFLALAFGLGVFGALLRFVSFRYRLAEDEIVLQTGLLSRNVRHVPYARIQNIDLVQNPFHRAFGVAEVRLETASGDKPEAIFRVLSLDAVETMRRQVFRTRREAEAVAGARDEPAARRLLEVSTRELVLLGLTSNRGVAIIAAAFGLFWQLDPLGLEQGMARIDPRKLEGIHLPSLPGPLAVALLAIVGFVLLIGGLKALSVFWTLVKFHGFTLVGRGDDLRASYGLLTRITVTIPRQRIQLLSIRRGPIHRWAGMASIQVETAGSAEGGDDGNLGKLWIAPMIRDGAIAPLLAEVLPGVAIDGLEWQPLAPRAVRRVRNRGLFVATVGALAAAAAFDPIFVLLFLPAAAFAEGHARLFVAHAAYALTPEAVVYRSGWWRRKMSVVRYSKIQVVAVGQTPFDLRHRMASLAVDTAGAGRIGHRIAIPYLERSRAAG